MRTIVDPARLRRNLARLKRQDWAIGRDEGAPGVGTIAALVPEAGAAGHAALVVLYVLGGRRHSEVVAMRDAVRSAALSIPPP